MKTGPKRRPLKDRLEARIERIPLSDCWLYTGALMKNGYGVIGEGGSRGSGAKLLLAHRAAWMVYRSAIPDGMDVCHHCDVPRCVNPAHLFVGTRKDNMRDAMNKGRMTQVWKGGDTAGAGNAMAVLTAEQVVAMRDMRGQLGTTYAALGRIFGVHKQTAFRICTGRSWSAEKSH